jgi:hypothetical protein
MGVMRVWASGGVQGLGEWEDGAGSYAAGIMIGLMVSSRIYTDFWANIYTLVVYLYLPLRTAYGSLFYNNLYFHPFDFFNRCRSSPK